MIRPFRPVSSCANVNEDFRVSFFDRRARNSGPFAGWPQAIRITVVAGKSVAALLRRCCGRKSARTPTYVIFITYAPLTFKNWWTFYFDGCTLQLGENGSTRELR